MLWFTPMASTFASRSSRESRRISPTFTRTRLFVTAYSEVTCRIKAFAPVPRARIRKPSAGMRSAQTGMGSAYSREYESSPIESRRMTADRRKMIQCSFAVAIIVSPGIRFRFT